MHVNTAKIGRLGVVGAIGSFVSLDLQRNRSGRIKKKGLKIISENTEFEILSKVNMLSINPNWIG